ncbi:MAG: alginate export family protein [Candidatus Omnitrophica bacterium]|nr:alginate export family protein [Candidatus Omnitrophota bacterium]
MSKRLIVVLTLLFVVGIAFAAYAEVQNVKVSGDIVASWVGRKHFGLFNSVLGDKSQFNQNLFMTQARIRVDADLTDNVMATVRLINERVWNGNNDTNTGGDNKIDLDLAYVALKEFLYSPLSITVGRQEIRFGNGLVMGNAKTGTGSVNIPSDLTLRKAFDAVRATLNYDPLIVDLLYAKVRQESYTSAIGSAVGADRGNKDDINLMGVNASYAINKNTNASVYYYHKNDKYKGGSAAAGGKSDEVSTIGGLVSSTPIENLTASLEAAYQFGRSNTTDTTQKNHQGYAVQAMADYTFAKVKTTPKIGVSWTYLSGGRATDDKNAGWDPMFYDQKLNNITYTLLPFTNMNVINLKASCKPMDDVTVYANYGYYEVAKTKSGETITSPFSYNGTNAYYTTTYTNKTHLGDAIDLTATYDYTEDVQFALTGGWFKPGRALAVDERDATQLIGSMKVVF